MLAFYSKRLNRLVDYDFMYHLNMISATGGAETEQIARDAARAPLRLALHKSKNVTIWMPRFSRTVGKAWQAWNNHHPLSRRNKKFKLARKDQIRNPQI